MNTHPNIVVVYFTVCLLHHCDVIIITTESKANDEVRRMKLAYSDASIDGRQSVLIWSDLLSKKMQKQDITLTELRQAVQQGLSNVM